MPSALTLPLSALFPHYTHLLLAYGASQPKSLPYLHPSFALPALSLVHWYTGHPSSVNAPPPPLPSTKHLTLVGHGNVSLDIARLLLTNPSSLSSLDVPQCVVELMKASTIEHINIVSRRGPAQVAFTAKELREMMNLPLAALKPISSTLFDNLTSSNLTRQQTRILELMRKGSKVPFGTTGKTWSLEFFRTPISSQINRTGTKTITFDLNKLDDQGRAQPTGETEMQQTDLVVTSLGYHSDAFFPSTLSKRSSRREVAQEDQWHDPILGRVRTSTHGRVIDADGRHVHNVYASGWAANGARGVLASTMHDAYDVADTMVEEYLANETSEVANSGPEPVSASTPHFESRVHPLSSGKDLFRREGMQTAYPEWLEKAAREGGRKRVVTYRDWQLVNTEEVRRGKELGKERERMSWEEVDTFLA